MEDFGKYAYMNPMISSSLFEKINQCPVTKRDFGERMKRAENLNLSQSQITETFLDAISDPVYFKDSSGKYVLISDSFEKLVEKGGDEIIGSDSEKIFSGEDGREMQEEDESVISGELSIENEEKLIECPDGVERWFSVRKIPYSGIEVEKGMIGILRDITERKEAKQELEESEVRYRQTIENANIGIGVYGKDKKMEVLNEAMKEIIGYDKEETPTLAQWFKKLYPDYEKRREISRLWFEEIAKNGQITGIETEIRRKDGEKRTLLFNAVQLNTGNVIFFAEDITELVEAREMLEQKKEDLENKNKELEAFVYTVSHDLRTPLISLEGFSDMLREEFGDELGEDGTHYLDRIQANVQKMDEFIDDLLQLSRVGRKEPPEEEVEVGEIVEEVLDDLRSRIDEKGINTEVKGEMPTLSFQRKRLYQIFSNLISNACKYMGEQEDPRIEIGVEDQEDSWLFWVEDNGIGIDEEQKDKIFEIFHREKRCDAEGTGVGLAIVKRIIENKEGEIWVESEKGEGSTFYIEFPKNE